MKSFISATVLLLLVACSQPHQEAANPSSTAQVEAAIREVMRVQQDAWNQGNLEVFMESYWKSDSMQFVGKSIQQGWNATLERYKKNYPTLEAMGKLQFDLWQIVRLSDDAYLVTGQYTLTRTNDQPSGPFTLIFRLKNGKWVITYDHTS